MRKIIALLLSIFLLSSLVVAQAVDITKLIQSVQFTEDSIRILGKELPQGGSLTVSVDSQQIPGASFSTVEKEGVPVTIYCLVDTSKNMTNAQIKQQKDVLKTISSRMGSQDSMVIATLGSSVNESQLLTNLEARNTAIDTIARAGKKTNLYKAVVDSIHSLKTKIDYAPDRVLLILSDGINDGTDSTTELQAVDAIHASELPVYGVAILGDYPSEHKIKQGNHVVRMAQESVGGLGFTPNREKLTAASAAESIWASIQNGSVFDVPLAEVDSRSNAASIRINYVTSDSKFEDDTAIDLSGVAVSPQEPVPETTVSETGSADGDESEVGETEETVSVLVWAVAGALALVVAVAVFVVLNQKKKRVTAGNATVDIPETPVSQHMNTAPSDISAFSSNLPPTEPLEEEAELDVTVHLIGIMHSDVSCSFGLVSHKQQTLGRNQKADIIVNAQDAKLSGLHCILEWDGNCLYVQDSGSTNGSSLDGIPIAPGTWHHVENGAKLMIGEYEYRVTIQKK